ncbi:hypothetical protein HBN76_04310 [Pseudomonas sp. WS 5013]|uniref:hypothetical protein n=1 Tax=Pseudomonas sp. WS 5013 TaxID=2717475 RepID=UPI001472D38B|nr:hypothetical protein [Pseudomonas sp. WS 5013]NMY40520.1 hypothetical protein [Pseudomonas sp. WS 5013]
MVAYNFKARFAAAVRDGSKLQTIRAAGKRRPPRPGEQLQLYTGLRTKHVCLLRNSVCTSAEEVQISARMRTVRVIRDNRWYDLDQQEIQQLALVDGFASADEFFAFFAEAHGKTLSGYLIKWEA